MRLTHVSVTARDATELAAFYREAFEMVDRRPPRRLIGDAVDRGNGHPGSDILVIWLNLPGTSGPFLEIMEYKGAPAGNVPRVDALGFRHLAFEVSDLATTLERLVGLGGTLQGEVTDFGTEGKPHLMVYARDPEGNILELEQQRSP